MSVAFSREEYLATKSRTEIPDTNNFFLTVESEKGKVIYSGMFGAAPEPIVAEAGKYHVRALSAQSLGPAFEAPVYGDEKTVEIKSGTAVSVELLCIQVNAGLRLVFDDSFNKSYPGSTVLLSSDDGNLEYSLREERVAYFSPGTVRILLRSDGDVKQLGLRSLNAREILTLDVSAPETAGGNVTIKVDTTRTWISDRLLVGEGDDSSRGSDVSNALSVGEAKLRTGESGLWVYGYIVGGDLSSSKASFTPPFSSKTNIVLAEKSSCTSRDQCLSVQLRQGDIRDALNLVDNPDVLGRQVFVKGDVVASYYGLPGIQNITEYQFSNN